MTFLCPRGQVKPSQDCSMPFSPNLPYHSHRSQRWTSWHMICYIISIWQQLSLQQAVVMCLVIQVNKQLDTVAFYLLFTNTSFQVTHLYIYISVQQIIFLSYGINGALMYNVWYTTQRKTDTKWHSISVYSNEANVFASESLLFLNHISKVQIKNSYLKAVHHNEARKARGEEVLVYFLSLKLQSIVLHIHILTTPDWRWLCTTEDRHS